MMLIVSSRYNEKDVFQRSNELYPEKFFLGTPGLPNYTPFALAAQPIHFLDRSAVLETQCQTLEVSVFSIDKSEGDGGGGDWIHGSFTAAARMAHIVLEHPVYHENV